MKETIIIFLLTIYLPFHLFAQSNISGLPYYHNYTSDNYQTIDQNWSVLQDSNGIIYIGNANGILEFDGVSWQLIKTSEYIGTIRTLDMNSNGIVYAGSIQDFGYIDKTISNEAHYHSLKDKLPTTDRSFNDIWKVVCNEELVFFMSEKKIFIFKGFDYVHTIETKGKFSAIQNIGSIVYIFDTEKGLCKYKNGILSTVEGGETLRGISFTFLSQATDNEILFGLNDGSISKFKNGKLFTWFKNTGELSEAISLNCCIQFKDSSFIVGTNEQGIIFIDKNGTLIKQFTTDEGLLSNSIVNLYLDDNSNLWVLTTGGITYYELNSPFTYFFEKSGLKGVILSATEFNKKIYFAGVDGIYVSDTISTGGINQTKFKLYKENRRQSWQIRTAPNYLIIPANPGIEYISDSENKYMELNKSNIYDAIIIPDNTNMVIVGDNSGLLLVDIQKETFSRLFEMQEAPRYLQYDSTNSVWLINEKLDKLYRMELNPAKNKVLRSSIYGEAHGLPKKTLLSMILFDNRLNVLTDGGFYEFLQETNTFIPNEFLNKCYNKMIFLAWNDNAGNIWFGGMNYLTMLKKNNKGEYIKINENFNRILDYTLLNSFKLSDGNYLITCNKGAIHYDSDFNYIGNEFNSLIRQAWYTGNKEQTNSIFDSSIVINRNEITAIKKTITSIPYECNTINILYSSAFYTAPEKTRYSYFLEGFDNDWSAWVAETKKEYTNLPEGEYIFYLKAKNIFGEISTISKLYFIIEKPWYRTIWAYFAMIFVVIIILITTSLFYSKQLIKKNVKLENLVRERTKKIELQNEEIISKNIEIESQKEELLAERDNLQNMAINLEELMRFKTNFFTNISHELKTPLTLIISPLAQLESSEKNQEQKNLLSMMLRNGKKLLNLINQLLDISKIEKGRINLYLQYADINSYIESLLQNYKHYSNAKGIKISFQSEENELWLMFDKDIIEKILDNLISNALKFTDKDGFIIVSTEKSSTDQLKLAIKDSGIGIANTEIEKIFDRYYQSETNIKRKGEGVGIGLAFVKELVEIHNGFISVNSIPEQGTEFIIQLNIENINNKKISDKLVKSDIYNITETIINNEKNEIQVSLLNEEKRIILLVEDHEDMRNYIARSIGNEFTIHTASDGTEGLDLAQKIIPDLIISDVMMPNMNGYELTRELKNNILTSHIPVILLTAKSSEESRLTGYESLADDYLTKPFIVRELLIRIKNLIRLRNLLKIKYQKELIATSAEVTTTPLDEKFLKQAIQIVFENLSNSNFGIDFLCTELGMSRPTLHRKLKGLTSQSTSEFINSIRLKHAASLIKQKAGSISEIAYISGFNSISYFNVSFKKQFGVTPTEYK